MLVAMTTVSFYLITAYTPTLGQSELHLTYLASLMVTLCVGLSNFIWLPVLGEKTAPDHLYGAGAFDRLPRHVMADSGTFVACRCSQERVLAGLQPCDGFAGRIYPGNLYLPDPYYGRPRYAGGFGCRLRQCLD